MVFRGETRTPRQLHPLEKALLLVTATHLCFLPWAIGGMTNNPWPLWISLVFAVLGFVLALVPRQYTEAHAREGEFKLVMWPKLVRFPIFWLGLVLLLFMTVQALNPAFRYYNTGRIWSIEPVAATTWLPTGVEAPMNGRLGFEDMNAWRMILMYAAPWLTVCSLWVGITRRLTLLALFATLAVNGAVLALVGMVEIVHPGQGQILWLVDAPKHVSTFVYKNHAGAYFNLVLAVCAALIHWHFSRSERRLERTNPAPLFVFCAVLVAMMTLLSHSRMATILMMVFLLVSMIGFGVRRSLSGTENRNPAMLGVLGVVLVLFVGLGVYYLDQDKVVERMESLGSEREYTTTVERRLEVDQGTWAMVKDRPLTGWGAGSFRYVFQTLYRNRYPLLVQPAEAGHGWRWDYAHNDHLQILAELGLFGALLLLAGTAYWLFKLFRHEIFSRPHALLVLLGLLLLLVHSVVDLQLYCPAVLLTWCVLWVLTTRWVEFEDSRVHD